MDKGTFSDSFLGMALIRIGDIFGYSSNIAAGIPETIEDAYALDDAPDKSKTVKKEHFDRRKEELDKDSAEGGYDNPHGYVRLSLMFTPDKS